LGYATLSGAVMLVTIGVLGSLDLTPAAVAIVSLPLGSAIYCGALAAIGDRTYRRIVDFGRSCLEAPNNARGAARQ
jgi:membrane protein DedA with SNARE-associated domain